MPWGMTLFFFFFVCKIAFCVDEKLPETYLDSIALGDHYFQSQDYFLAFETYLKGANVLSDRPEIHYRLGRLYGLLEPQKALCDKEYIVAITLMLKKIPKIHQLSASHFRCLLEIPIDPKEQADKNFLNPVSVIKTDLDKDESKECFVLFKRGNYAYTLFVIDFFDKLPRVSHLATFFTGISGDASILFEDLNKDGVEEIVVESRMKDFLNLFVFQKTVKKDYQEVLSLPALWGAEYFFLDFDGDQAKEIEVYEKIREDKGEARFSENGLCLTQRSIYFWLENRLKLFSSEVVHDDAYVINKFFLEIINGKDVSFTRAYEYIHPDYFFGFLNHDNARVQNLKDFFQQEDYQDFLGKKIKKIDIFKNIRFEKDERYNSYLGWDEDRKSPDVAKEEVAYRVYLNEKTYLLVLRNRGEWRIEEFSRIKNKEEGWMFSK
ncbi:hypothetical protein AB834_07260 [PVC group bacterium (ex Bugula neritina AB1)]|nr:hypothetical protein AB834_07260 [PVC group bacterium (ex Bugula neritina AB1)]